jgi:hypothetical protein
VSAQLALEDGELKDRIPIYSAAVISDDDDDGMDDSKSYSSATEFPLAKEWDTAMKEVLDPIGPLQPFRDFVLLQERRKALRSHWVYQIMRDRAGNVQLVKARLVCGGNHQIKGIDYQATYSPIAHLDHVTLTFAIAIKYDLEIPPMDVSTAFLGVDMEEEINLHPQQGYFGLLQNGSHFNDPRLTKTSGKMVLHLRKSLHGLKQSSNRLYGTFEDFLISIGFMASCVGSGLFVLELHDSSVAAVIPNVDALLINDHEDLIIEIKEQIKKRSRMHDIGSVSMNLSMTI